MESKTRLGNGRYSVVRLLGEGAQGVTYEATNPEGRAVAIKRFDVRGAKSWKDVELAEREARVLSTLDHPLVPRYIEHFEENGELFLVMEKVEGETIDAVRQREGLLSEPEVRRFLACADRALSYLHGRASPVVHRDIKPRNVVRRSDGSYVLVDFGAVSELMVRKGSSTIVGTMGYMAPEQFQGRALPATDVYAVGATALAALTGQEPETLPHKGLKIDVRAALGDRVSPELILALERMVEPDPDLRAATLAAALDGSHVARASTAPAYRAPAREPVLMAPLVQAQPQREGRKNKRDRAPLSPEDAVVKSIRNLLWLLWGLAWIIVPVILGPLHAGRAIPVVMFGSLAMLFIVTWHKGAVIRALVRKLNGGKSEAAKLEAEVHQRVELGPPQAQIRVHPSELRPEELLSDTEVSTDAQSFKRRQQR